MTNRKALAAVFLGLCVAAPAGSRAEDAPKLSHKLKKGWSQDFTVTRSSTTKSETGQGDFESKSDETAVYRVTVADAKDSGAVTLDVTIASLKVESTGGRGGNGIAFDSTKPAGADEGEAVGALRNALKSTIHITVEGGQIKEITGLPEIPRPERPADGERPRGGFRGGRLLSAVGAGSLRRDLGLILATQLQGQALEKGKEYQPQAVERPNRDQEDGDTPRRGQGFGRGGFGGTGERMALQFEGADKGLANFLVKAAPPPEGADNERFGTAERKVEGKAAVSLEDGLLQSLEATSSTVRKGERNGNSFSFATTVKTSVSRGEAKAPAKKVEL